MTRVAFLYDGLNLFHAVRNSPRPEAASKLDLVSLSRAFLSRDKQLCDVIYFVAPVVWSGAARLGQQRYLKLLVESGVLVVNGRFRSVKKSCAVCGEVRTSYTEKETDANIVAWLFHLAVLDRFDEIALVSADSDFRSALRLAQETFPDKRFGILLPYGSVGLRLVDAADFVLRMKEVQVRTCQFADIT